jgi:hypothetical protein
MDRWTVNHRYSARRDGVTFGPWEGGETVELSADEAAWIGRDSPGVLSPFEEPKPEPKERQQPPVKDRQHRGGANRSS